MIDPFSPFPNDLPPVHAPAGRTGNVLAAAQQAKLVLAEDEPDTAERARRLATVDTLVAAHKALAAYPGAEAISMSWQDKEDGKSFANGYITYDGQTVGVREGGTMSAKFRALPPTLREGIRQFFQAWKLISGGMSEDNKREVLNNAFTDPLAPGEALERIQAQTPLRLDDPELAPPTVRRAPGLR